MNDTLAPVRLTDVGPPPLDVSPIHAPHAGFIDRIELRIAPWLLLRGARRRDAARDHRDRQRILSDSRARRAREHAALRAHALRSVRT